MKNKRLLVASLMTCMLLSTPNLTAKAAYDPSSVMDLLVETTTPSDVSIQVGDKYYDLGPLSYSKGNQGSRSYIWNVDSDGIKTLVENASASGNNSLSIGFNNNPARTRLTTNLSGADLSENFIGQGLSSGSGGAISYTNSSYSIGEISSFFVGNHAVTYGGAIQNQAQIDSITGDFIGNYLDASGNAYGGAISNASDGHIGSINSNFIQNYVTTSSSAFGGAIHNTKNRIESINGDFIGNYSETSNQQAFGGAIANRSGGKIGNISANFIGNYAYEHANANSSKTAMGGAIANYQTGSTIDSISGSFIANFAKSNNNTAYGGAIYNATSTATISEIVAGFVGNYAEGDAGAYGGAIYNNIGTANVARIESINGVFKGNFAASASGDALGGAIYNANTTTTASNIAHIGDISGSFESNYVLGKTSAKGGAIYNAKGIIDSIDADFTSNYAQSTGSGAFGGAIYNNVDAEITSINGTFSGNSITPKNSNAYGGAIYNAGIIDEITGSFEGNHINTTISAMGGAIANGLKTSSTTESGSIGTIDAYFEGNTINSSSDVHGGAIQNGASQITTISGDFLENTVGSSNNHSYGGAIANRRNGKIDSILGTFDDNHATTSSSYSPGSKDAHGGAIANYQETSTISYIEGEFTNNYALAEHNAAYGGAIYNATTNATIGEIVADFIHNDAEGAAGAYGGAIYNNLGSATKARIGSITGNFDNNWVYIRGDLDISNREAFGGAIYNANTTDTASNIAHIGAISGSFTDNHAEGDIAQGGAIYNSKAIIDSIEADFEKNYVIGNNEAYGGAIFNTNSTIGVITGNFENNISSGSNNSLGGAIYNLEGIVGDITGSFKNNHTIGLNNSSFGGAIYNEGGTIGAVIGDFEDNISVGLNDSAGGAVFNSGGDMTLIDSSFKNNATTGYGGAIVNFANGSATTPTINIIANNKDVEFTGNKQYVDVYIYPNNLIRVVGGSSSAIYNDHGIINLNAKAGQKITFNDYVTGEWGIININKENAYLTLDSDLDEIIKDIDQIGGDYIFNSTVDCNTINLFNGGTITLGSDAYMELDGFTNDDNNGTLDALNGNAEQAFILNATELNSDLNFKMDLDVTDTSNILSDTLSVDGDNSYGNIVISDINLTGNITIADFDEDTEIVQRVLYGNDEYTTISLGTDVLDDFNTTVTKDITGSDDWTGPDINWNDEFGGYTIERTIESAISVTGSDTGLQDTLDWTILVTDGDKEYTDQVDNLALVNQYQTTETRHFNFDTSNDEFVVTQDSGTTAAGKLVINGVKDDNGNKSTINGTDAEGNQHNLFDMSSGTGKVVEINNTKITGANTVADIANGNTLVLNNIDITGNANGIINNGNLNLTGTNTIADSISNTVSSTSGIMSILSGATTISDSANVEQGTLQTASNALLDINGTVTVTDKLNNLGEIDINDSGILNLDGNNVEITGKIVNNNQLNLNGSATNSSLITNNADMVVNEVFVNESVINGDGVITNNSNNFNNQSSINQNEFVNEGIVTNSGKIVANTIINNNTITTNSEKLISDNINNSGTLNFTSGSKTVSDISGSANGNVNLSTGGNFTIDNKISGTQLSLNDATLYFGSNADISQAAAFNVNGGAIDVLDNKLNNVNLGNVNLNGKTNLALDFNLSNLTSDTFDANVTNNGGVFHVSNINFVGSPTNIKDSIRIHLGDTTKLGRANVTSDYYDLPDVMTPIRRLSGSLSNGWLTYDGTGNSFRDFNPSVMASPVASLVGGFLTQSQVLQDGFYHMDRYTKYSQSQRMAAENENRYADSTGTAVYTASSLPETSSAMWVKPYATFESVDLKNGTGVSNVAYGMLYGGDTDLIDLGRGYKGVISAFIGYNGSHQSYNGIDMNQQGGTLGVTGTLYKGNFFTGLTVSTGASGGEAFTSYGTDKFSMLTAGIANKTGYNIEVAQGKLIIQPSLFLGYTFANTFDYTNSAGVKIKSDPLNVLQIAPGVKLIGNLANGWQPYLGVDMVWNIMGKTDFTANQTQLPNMSVKPYVQYGAGVQKSWGKRFTAFFQTMLRNGGRTGVILQAGFRWTLGSDKKSASTSKSKKVIKE